MDSETNCFATGTKHQISLNFILLNKKHLYIHVYMYTYQFQHSIFED